MQTKHISTVVLFFALVGVLMSGLFYVIATQKNKNGAVSTRKTDSSVVPTLLVQQEATTGTASLSLAKNTGSLTVGEEITVEALLSSPENVNGAEITLHYDPSVFTFKEVKPGPYFTQPIEVYNHVDAASGTVVYAVGTLTATPGTAAVAVFRFVPLTASEQTSVVLDQSSIVSISGGKEATMTLPVTETYSILK